MDGRLAPFMGRRTLCRPEFTTKAAQIAGRAGGGALHCWLQCRRPRSAGADGCAAHCVRSARSRPDAVSDTHHSPISATAQRLAHGPRLGQIIIYRPGLRRIIYEPGLGQIIYGRGLRQTDHIRTRTDTDHIRTRTETDRSYTDQG